MRLDVGQLESALAPRYSVERVIGRGGMAVVYLGRDLRHERSVAIKVLRPEVASGVGASRFLSEIKLTARLNHPHILPLLDSGECGGFLYYVMPYVEGESLRHRLSRLGKLAVADALQIARDVADALDSAHRHGVVHRDVKPENILLEEGHAFVADFGIARAISAAGSTRLTETGIVVGTPAYMSPEQLQGTLQEDGRCDIYSLGCVLHEMLTGSLPATPPAALSSLTHQHGQLPGGMRRILRRALAPNPNARFSTARELADALAREQLITGLGTPTRARARRRLAALTILGLLFLGATVFAVQSRSTAGSANISSATPTIAVFPFRVETPDTTHDYLGKGLVVLLHSKLSGDDAPRAIDPTTAIVAWERTADGQELSREESLQLAERLGAQQVILGSLVGMPTGLAITATLLSVPDGGIRAQASTAGTEQMLSLLIDRLISELLARQTPTDEQRLAVLSDSLAANKAYLRGRQAVRDQEWWEAQRHFDRALEIDSGFALAALALVELGERIGVEQQAVEHAWALRDRLPDRDQTYLRSLTWVGPNYPAPSTWAELFEAQRAATAVIPDRAEIWLHWGSWLLVVGPYVGSRDWLERATWVLDSALALNPTLVEAVNWRLEAALLEGDPVEIREWARRYFRVDSSDIVDARRWWVAAALGDTVELDRFRERLHAIPNLSANQLLRHSINDGFPLDDAELVIERRWQQGMLTQPWRSGMAWARAAIASAQGRARDAASLLDTVVATGATDSFSMAATVINLGLLEPGYEDAATDAARRLAGVVDTTGNLDVVCHHELWRVANGDTSETRRTIGRVNRLVHEWRPPHDLASHTGSALCPVLLEAMIEWFDTSGGASPALDRLDALMRQGPRREINAAVANLAVARWREARGEISGALSAVRRRGRSWGGFRFLVVPALLRQEGRLAARAGDTTGAIRAYRHYLLLRTHPDPAVRPQVDSVKTELARLVGEPQSL